MIRRKGKIINWNDDKGFGFILPTDSDSQKNIFVHIKSFSDKRIRPEEGQQVTYTVQKNNDGRESAIKVSRASDHIVRNKNGNNSNKNITPKYNKINTNKTQLDLKSTHSISPFYIIIILGFLGFLLHFSIEEKLPPIVIVVYIVMGIITYYIYSEDKDSAINNERRTSEQRLLTLSLFGGWIGALIAQQKFRHKTKKTSFQVSFWTTVFFNIMLLSSAFRIIHF
ncbi:MAG: hypothetical protein P794_06275 [Epsilonproteobacteria bacterium (ex Lamellibrachia satsuma)]|nr:MAG: hypothetical protein P794_06275 [Epsilonproteobacteria bacterium (ex Lamellibrachia satsuma)]